ncbi:MAG: hypothetical protein ACM3Q2_12210, partial [Syntrophothermus sp.]
MTEQETKKSNYPLNKKWITIAGLVLLTIGLIFVFRQKSLHEFVDQQKENLVGFYAQNLEPIFSGNILSREDVFNFAFYKELPVDKKNNQILSLGVAPDGKDFFEFRNAGYNPSTNNLQQFVKYLKLNTGQKAGLDSILDVYKSRIQDQVLVNDKNTLAINSDLWNLNKALAADLMLFASRVNKLKADELFTDMLDSSKQKSLQKIVADVRSSENNKYIFVHSDTIFTGNFNYKTPEPGTPPKERDQKISLKFDKELTKNYSQVKTTQNNFHVQVDTNYFRIKIPELNSIYIAHEMEINQELAKVAKKLQKFSIRFTTPVIPAIPVPPDGKTRHVEAPPAGDFEMNIDLDNLDSVLETAIS